MESVLSYLGKVLKSFSLLLFPPFLASVIFWDFDVIIALGITIESSLIAGFLMERKLEKGKLTAKYSLILAFISWTLISVVGSLPYIMVLDLPLIDALFESFAGYTTTGITMVTPEEVPRALLFYRSYTEWIGGLGVVLLFIVIASPVGLASKLYLAEGRTERLEPSIANTATRIFYLYSLLTLFGALALYLAGMSVFDSANFVLTAISTGGFATKSSSIAEFGMPERIVIMGIIFIGAIGFAVHQRLFSFEFRALMRNVEVRAMLVLIALATLLLSTEVALGDALFQAVSGATTAGYSTINISELSEFGKLTLIPLLLAGGGYGSTAGALKLIRFIVVLKSIEWFVRRYTSPRGTIIPFKIGGRVFSDREIFTALSFVPLYLLFIALGTMLFVKLGHSMTDSMFDISTALGNGGLHTIESYTSVEKVVLMVYMIVGRLEIVPFVILLTSLRR